MSVFDFSNYRPPSEARALEAQAFAERQLGAALANKRANTLALAQTAMQSEAQKSLENYRTDNLDLQRSASAMAAMDRDRSFGLQEKQDKRANTLALAQTAMQSQAQKSLEKYRTDNLDLQRSASAMAAMDRDRSFGLQEKQFTRAEEIDVAKQKFAEDQFLMQKAQIQSQQQSLDTIYNSYENQIKEIEKEIGTGGTFTDGLWDSEVEQRRKNQIDELRGMQQNLLIEGYIPLGLTPGAPMQASPQVLQSPPQASPQASQTPQPFIPPTSTPSYGINWTTAPAKNASTVPEASPFGQNITQQQKTGPYPAINVPSNTSVSLGNMSLIKQGQMQEFENLRRKLSGSGNLELNPSSKTKQPATSPASELAMPSRLGNFRRFLPTPPPTESKVQSALSAMADMYEQQGMAPEEALGQAYKDARTNSDLFRKTLSQ